MTMAHAENNATQTIVKWRRDARVDMPNYMIIIVLGEGEEGKDITTNHFPFIVLINQDISFCLKF